MSAKDITTFILQLFTIITAWPIILLIVVLIFRREISNNFSLLAVKLTKANLPGGTSLEFNDAAIKALQTSVESGVEELKDNPAELVNFVKKQVQKLSEVTSTPQYSKSRLPLSGFSILWVDDNPLNNIYEEDLFEQLGAIVSQAISTSEALQSLSSHKYDLIISDVHRNENGLSNANAGYELLDEVKQKKAQIPFVFYTGNTTTIKPQYANLADGVADMPGRLVKLVSSLLLK